MFYYPDVLHRRTGCFSTIWLAATSGIRVSSRELLKVNVRRTCGDIVDYVTAQVPPPQPNLPNPRFSLYLSSQLQYGVVVVYHRQCGLLLEEMQQIIDRLLRFKRHMLIDMAESDRRGLDIPDHLCMMEEAEGAQDPFFGLMESDQLPSPYAIRQTEFVIEEHSLVPSPHHTLDNKDFRSLPAVITLTEKEQFIITTAEQYFEGDEIPEATAREIDLLMDQPDHFRKEGEEQQTEKREPEGAVSFIDQLKETVVGTEQDSLWLLDKELGQPVEEPLVAAALEMTPLHASMPAPPSGSSGKDGDRATQSSHEEVVVRPLRKPGGRFKRQLVFADPHVQISDRAIKEQIKNPLAETLLLSKVLLDFPSLTKHVTPAQLFSAPCGSLFHADLQSLWKQQACLTVLPENGEKRRWEEEEARGESEEDRETQREERKRRISSTNEIFSESGQPAEASSAMDVIFDKSKDDRSVSDVITPISRGSPQDDVQPPMKPIAEENVLIQPEAETGTESRDTLRHRSLSPFIPSWMASILQSDEEVTFDWLLPPEASRSTAAHTFFKLLELLSAGQAIVRQSEAYGNITINPAAVGPH